MQSYVASQEGGALPRVLVRWLVLCKSPMWKRGMIIDPKAEIILHRIRIDGYRRYQESRHALDEVKESIKGAGDRKRSRR